MKAIQKLLQIQKRTVQRHPRSILNKLKNNEISLSIDNVEDSNFDSILDRYEDLFAEMPTPYQEPIFYLLLTESFQRITTILNNQDIYFQHKKIEYKDIPVYGSIHAKIYNAFITLASDKPLIIFCEGLFEIASMLCDIISAKVILDSTDKGNRERDGQIIRYFIDSLLSFLLFNTTSGAIRMILGEKDEIALQTQIMGAFLLFVSSHEYSHLLLNHLEKSGNLCLNIAGENECIKNYNWQQELDADELATIIAMHDNKTTSDIHICGIFVFCNALHIIEMQSNPTEYNTHPPSEIRKEYFCQTIMNLTSGLRAMSITDVIIEGMLRQYIKFIDYLDEKNISVTQNNYMQIQQILYYEYEIKEYEI